MTYHHKNVEIPAAISALFLRLSYTSLHDVDQANHDRQIKRIRQLLGQGLHFLLEPTPIFLMKNSDLIIFFTIFFTYFWRMIS